MAENAFIGCEQLTQAPDIIINADKSKELSYYAKVYHSFAANGELKGYDETLFDNCTTLAEIAEIITGINKGSFLNKNTKNDSGEFIFEPWDAEIELETGLLLCVWDRNVELCIPEGTIGLEDNCFESCGSVKTLKIPSSLVFLQTDTFLGEFSWGECFRGLESLERIIVDPDNKVFSSYEGVLYNKAMTRILFILNAIKELIAIQENICIKISREKFTVQGKRPQEVV